MSEINSNSNEIIEIEQLTLALRTSQQMTRSKSWFSTVNVILAGPDNWKVQLLSSSVLVRSFSLIVCLLSLISSLDSSWQRQDKQIELTSELLCFVDLRGRWLIRDGLRTPLSTGDMLRWDIRFETDEVRSAPKFVVFLSELAPSAQAQATITR
jgi:hypothetical protein